MTEIAIHPEVEAEYEQALAWYHDRSPQAAERFEAVPGFLKPKKGAGSRERV